jgi:hypothetical protein
MDMMILHSIPTVGVYLKADRRNIQSEEWRAQSAESRIESEAGKRTAIGGKPKAESESRSRPLKADRPSGSGLSALDSSGRELV